MKGDMGESGGVAREPGTFEAQGVIYTGGSQSRRTMKNSELSDEQLFIYVHINTCALSIKLKSAVDGSATYVKPAGSKTHPNYSEL
jgi:hypothetical protein